jgi:hypothetical protein
MINEGNNLEGSGHDLNEVLYRKIFGGTKGN